MLYQFSTTFFRLEDFLNEDEIQAITDSGTKISNLTNKMIIPKKTLNSINKVVIEKVQQLTWEKKTTIRFQRLFAGLDVYEWISEIFENLLFQPFKVSVGFSFLTHHPTNEKKPMSYMYVAQELSFASAKIIQQDQMSSFANRFKVG